MKPDLVQQTRRTGPGRRALSSLRLPDRRDVYVTTLGLVALVTGLCAAIVVWPGVVPQGAFAPAVVLAGLLLGPRALAVVYGWLGLCVGVTIAVDPDVRPVPLAAVAMLAVVMVLMYSLSRSRSRIGVRGLGGEGMLVDLRDRLRLMGEMPELPPGWHAESALRSAHGDAFSGDFMVTARSGEGSVLEIVLVDVSGKGLRSGTRSLLLSGAFSGLLGATDAEGFLPAANTYLLRQSWGEGFATAVHVQVCTRTGAYSVATAGHPPAVKYSAGSGRWEVIEGTNGPLLGVLEEATFPRRHGVLSRGDAFLLYTDGVIESRTRQLVDGIDRMLGTAERSLRSGFDGLAARLCVGARAGEDDDRAVVVLWRD